MASKHDIKGRQLQIEEIISAIAANPVLISSLFRYKDANSFNDPQDIVDKNYVDNATALVAPILTFDESDLVPTSGDPDTDYNLPITLAAGKVILAIKVEITSGDDFNISPSAYRNGIIYGFGSNAPQTILVVTA